LPVEQSVPVWFGEAMAALLAHHELSQQQVSAALSAIMRGDCGDAEAAAFLVGLRMKGETASEIAAAATVMRQHMVRWDPGVGPILDTCGTGGGGQSTFNISTATAFVVAGAGVPVVKHGNRAVSSRSGSADVLAALGVIANSDVESAKRSLARCGLAFCFAPHFHPALRHVAALRRRLGFGTLFNWLGPLANPAGATHQLLGVGRLEMLDLIAGALAQLGTGQSLLVYSHDGLDEVSLSAPTEVRQVRGHEIKAWTWSPSDFGLGPVSLDEIWVDGPEASAAVIRSILDCRDGPATRIVLANSAAALMAAEKIKSLADGVGLAKESLRDGKAKKVLEALLVSPK
jgi:anthranilate phosphoribosyltransferase